MSNIRTCKTCLSDFVPATPNQKYCTPECRPSQMDSKRRCLTCHRAFVPSRSKKGSRNLYCSPHCIPGSVSARVAAAKKKKSTVHSFYQKDLELFAQRMPYTLNGTTWWATPCCYCGDPSEAEDHVLPISAFRKLLAAGNVVIPDDLLRMVPACHECNSLLGDKVFRSFEEKRLYAKAAIAHRYHKVLDYPHWDKEELETLKGSLKAWIARGEGTRESIFERLRF